MDKTKLAVILSIVALAVSLVANMFFLNQNSIQNSADKTRVDMAVTLTMAQISIDAEIERIGESLIYASQQLSTAGITGEQAHNILRALAANSSFIINAGTQNLNNTMVAAEPANWSHIEGRNVGEQTYMNPNPNGDITPVMSPIVPVVSDIMGIILAAPIFNNDKELIGYVSVIFDPETLVSDAVSSAGAEKDYELIVLQLDGLITYDSDPTQHWKYLFTDPAYANYPSLLSLGRRMVAASSGYGTYTYPLIGSTEVAEKECYWTTITAYGGEWRLIIVHAI